MSRVVIPDGATFKAYHFMRLVANYSEGVLENSVWQHVSELFPDYHVIPFKIDVEHAAQAGNIKRPDLAMIDKRFKRWGVIEVETSNHSLAHVIDQVSVFANGKYNAFDLADYVKVKLHEHCNKRVPLRKLRDLFKKEAPSVLVVVDEMKEEWRTDLRAIGVDLCTFELYKNTRGLHLYRAAGEYPVIPVREAHLRRVPASANLMEITTPFEFRRVARGKVSIFYEAMLTKWDYIAEKGSAYLRYAGGANPLIGTDTYVLSADRQEKYYLRKN
jgi:hypothetical protein